MKKVMGSDYLVENLGDIFKFRARIGNYIESSSITLFKKLANWEGIPFSDANKFTTSSVGADYLALDEKTNEEEFQKLVNSLGIEYDQNWKNLYKNIDVCYELDGIIFGSGTHASGVIMSEEESVLPVNKDGVLVFNGSSMEDMGYIKYDLLSLDAINPIREILGVDLDWENLSDINTYRMLKEGKVDFVFQLSGGIPKMMITKGMKVPTDEEIEERIQKRIKEIEKRG